MRLRSLLWLCALTALNAAADLEASDALRVGSYNIRLSGDWAKKTDGPRNTFQGFGKFKDSPVVEDGKTCVDRCIDYIYVSDGTRVLDFATHDDYRPGTRLYPSDHFPVTATIRLPADG